MKRFHGAIRILALFSVLSICLHGATKAEEVTAATARQVAENYVKLIQVREGGWGSAAEARVISVEPFTGATRDLGWLCHIEPTGYILVAAHAGMMPVVASSSRADIGVDDEGGMAAFLRTALERRYASIERRLGRAIAAGEDLRPLLDSTYPESWATLADPSFDPSSYPQRQRRSRGAGMDYQEGETMLKSVWNQSPPYNNDCPDHGCDWSDYGDFNANAWAGCVATAMSQIMRHLNWPPAGTGGSPYDDPFDWKNMRDKYDYNGAAWFNDENGMPVTQDEIDAVAELHRETGISVSMDYGCSGSGADMYACEEAMETHFFMSDGCQVLDRSDYTFGNWYELYQNDLNANRVVGVGIPNHMIVADGWRLEEIGGETWRMIHVQYGWGGSNDGWYSPDEIVGEPDDTMLRGVRPNCVLNSNPSGTYGSDGDTWRYFNRDVYTDGAIFEQGHWLQIQMPGFLISNTGTTSTDRIEFRGGSSGNTRLFMQGDPGGERRMIMIDGVCRINAGGQIAFY